MRPALQVDVLIAHFPYGGNGGISSEIPQIRQWEVQTALKAKSDPRIRNFYTQDFSDTPITYTRNKAIRHAKELGAHFLLMIDSDNDPLKHARDPWHKPFWDVAFDFLYERYSKGPHLIFAPYCGAPDGKENCFVFRWHDYGNHGDETEFSLEQYLREEAALMSGIHEAAAGPTGMLMMDVRCADLVAPRPVSKRQVLEELASGQISVSEALCDLKEGYFSYEWKDQRADEKASTEDVVFTRDVSLAGCVRLGYNPVYCAWDSWVGHHKPWNVGRPQKFMAEQVGESLRRAVLEDRRVNERVIDLGNLNRGDDPLARRLQSLAHASLEAYKANGNGHSKGSVVPSRLMPAVDIPLSRPVLMRWKPWDKALQFAEQLAKSFCGLVVEIGPGDRPFSAAKEFVGTKSDKVNYGGKPFHEIDLNGDQLPYADQSVDFVYCRHTLEDLDNPLHLLKEIRRVAKAGWIECPSPLAETCHDVDAPGAEYKGKGYSHHRSIVWSGGSKLHVVPKLPIIDSLPIVERHDLLVDAPWYWNTYHLWSGPLEFYCHRNEQDFNVHTDNRYEFLLRDACRAAINASRELYKLATSEEPASLDFFPWYDGLGTPHEHLDFLASIVKECAAGLPKVSRPRVLEVGSLFGKTAIAMADAGATVHCVDHWRGSPTDPSGTHVNAAGGSDEVYAEFEKQIGDRKDRTIMPWRRSSAEAAAMSWQQFNIIFIDAEHTYEACKEDIELWWPHLRDDGIMAIHDYRTIQFPGVTQAVRELFGDLPPMATCGHGSIAVVRKADYPDFGKEVCCVAAEANH